MAGLPWWLKLILPILLDLAKAGVQWAIEKLTGAGVKVKESAQRTRRRCEGICPSDTVGLG